MLPVLRKKCNRAPLRELAATTPRCVVAMESCSGSQFRGRSFAGQGHDVRLIPVQFVKPYVKANKNDFNDALRSPKPRGRATIPSVPLKNAEQLELQAIHRVCRRLIDDRTAAINQMRALLLEQEFVVGVGVPRFARQLPEFLGKAGEVLSSGMQALLRLLRSRWLELNADISELTGLLTRHATRRGNLNGNNQHSYFCVADLQSR